MYDGYKIFGTTSYKHQLKSIFSLVPTDPTICFRFTDVLFLLTRKVPLIFLHECRQLEFCLSLVPRLTECRVDRPTVHGLAQLVAMLVGSTKLLYAGPG